MKSLVSFPRYEEYKESGGDWLGEVPEHWLVVKMKYLYEDVSIKNKPEAELLSVTQDKGVVPRTWVETRMVMPSGNLESFKFISKGDFAISLRSFEGGLEYCHRDGIISPAYTVLKRKKPNLSQGFYKYLFKSKAFISELQTSVVGIREGKNISYDELCYSLLPIPGVDDQKNIATFLNQKTTQIDQAIDIKKKQIELLKERQQVVIQQAVTKGLDPEVRMRDSGVEWIGEVPEHWEVRVLKHLLSEPLKYGANESGYEYHKDLPRYIRITDFSDEGKLSDKNKLSLPWAIGKDYLLRDGDILLARSGATVGKSYQFKRYMSEENFYCFAGYLIKATANPDIILSDYLNLYLNSDCFLTWRNLIFNRATIENIGADKYAVLPVIVPSVIEQKNILKSVRKQSTVIDNLRAQHLNQIKNLQEYKSSLINSAVTGKIKITPDMIAAEE